MEVKVETRKDRIDDVLEVTKRIHDINAEIASHKTDIGNLHDKRGLLRTELARILSRAYE